MPTTPLKRQRKYFVPAGLALAGGIVGYCLTSGTEHIEGMGGVGAGAGLLAIQVIKTAAMVLFIGFLGFAIGMIVIQLFFGNRESSEARRK